MGWAAGNCRGPNTFLEGWANAPFYVHEILDEMGDDIITANDRKRLSNRPTTILAGVAPIWSASLGERSAGAVRVSRRRMNE